MRETGWLIESYYNAPTGQPMWLRLFGFAEQEVKPEWTKDSNLALRFAREQDAAWIALLYPKMCVCAKITEHIWDDGERFGAER